MGFHDYGTRGPDSGGYEQCHILEYIAVWSAHNPTEVSAEHVASIFKIDR
jgi:hypothetical protein